MAETVVATQYGGPDVLSVVEEQVPEPGPGEVTVRVKAIGVNPIDYKLYSGAFGADPDRLPMRLGHELAGVVSAVGPEAAGPAGPLRVGDEVVGYPVPGAYASEVTAGARAFVPKPPGLGWEAAAGLLLAGATALHLVVATSVEAGTTVLVHGASGGVGYLAAQLAAARGARVLGTAGPARHDRLRAHGVEPLTYGAGLADRVRALAPGGVDAAIDTVGTDEAIDVSLELVADRARIASIAGFQRGAQAGIKLLGSAPGADPGTEVRQNAWRELLPLAADGRLDVVVSRTFALKDTAAAHAYLAEGHAGGKVVLLP
jgi:NADPH:quinone reductase-like Zn-dependent oxidoreductase